MGEYFNETDLRTFKMGYCLGMAGFNLILIFVPQRFSCLLEQKETDFVLFCLVRGYATKLWMAS